MHVWTRLFEWTQEAETQLGPIIQTERADVFRGLQEGAIKLYKATGPDYWGLALIQFYEEAPGVLVCCCIAFAGHNTEAGVKVLAESAREAGAKALVCFTQKEGVARLYNRQGWEIEEFRLRLNL